MPKEQPKIVGLTGSIGSGKSAAGEILKELGAAVIDADQLAHRAVRKGEPALEEIAQTFGKAVLLADGELDRKKLGEIVFSDAAKRKALEKIVHPRVRELFFKEVAAQEKGKLIVYVVPLLFESGYDYKEIEKIVVVSAPREVCIERIMKRDGCTRELAEKKYDSQLAIEKKVKRADFVVENNGSLVELREQVKKVWAKF